MRLTITVCLLALGMVQIAFPAPRVTATDIDSVVHPITADIVSHTLSQAKLENADAVLIRLNTPGGLMGAMRQTIESIVASPIPVICYVTPSGGRAASAGFFILQACDIAAMAPGTNTGAAAPVLLGQEMDPTMRKKAENDAAASLRSLAAKRGRNSELAEKAVYESKSFTEKEALDNKLIEIIAPNESVLFEQLDGREITRFDGQQHTLRLAGAEVVEYELTKRESVMKAISDPNMALILLVVGALGLYIEFSSPGLIVPGVAGGILVLLGLSALSVLPINWIGAALLILALTLFVLEAKFVSYGVLSAGGALSMILGAILLIDSPIPELRIHLTTAVAVTLPFAIITTFLLTLVIRARARKVSTGAAGMVDEVGVTHTSLNPEGRIFIHGEFWAAISSTPVEAGARVRVVAVEELRLRVEPVAAEPGG